MSNVTNDMDRFGVLDVRSERDGETLVVALAGELDLATAPVAEQELKRAESSDARSVVLDLSGLTFISTTGIQLVLAADARSRAHGGRLLVVPGPAAVQRAFEISGLLERLPFAD